MESDMTEMLAAMLLRGTFLLNVTINNALFTRNLMFGSP
jgi:hypothetical protein